MIARPHEVGLVDFLEKLIPRAGVWLEPGITPCVKSPIDARIPRVNRRAGAMDVRLRGGD